MSSKSESKREELIGSAESDTAREEGQDDDTGVEPEEGEADGIEREPESASGPKLRATKSRVKSE